MGLDQMAYSRAKENSKDSFEISYWRKHPNLEGWMEKLYRQKGGTEEMFNFVELELTKEDLLRLQEDITNGSVAELGTTGFFFGNPSDEIYREHDLNFISKALSEIAEGRKIIYVSSW